jgi:hypothetical protein
MMEGSDGRTSPVEPGGVKSQRDGECEHRHGKWLIYPTDPLPPIPTWREFAWSYTHDDYDGPEDGRHGYAASPEACIAEIDEREGGDQ